jgi:preprotein translocase subunit SecA
VLKYDEVLDRQRKVIYAERRSVLEGVDLHEQVRHMIDDTVAGYVTAATAEGFPEEWDLDQLWTALKTLYPIELTVDDLVEQAGGPDRSALTPDFMTQALTADAQAAYDRREQSLGEAVTRELERRVLLSVLDRKWREHLYEMDYLKEGIGLRAMAQRDPLVEYQREGYDLFAAMMDGIKEESIGYLFHLEVQVQDTAQEAEAAAATAAEPAAADETQPAAEPVPTGVAEEPAAARKVPTAVGAGPERRLVAKGLDGPKPRRLEYTAPTVDGAGGVEHHAAGSGDGEVPELGPDASRAERRRAARAARKGGN